MATFSDFFTLLQTSGAYDSIIPFFFLFTILLAFLEKVKPFGKDNTKKYNVLTALLISLMVIIPHVTNSYPPGMDVVQIFLNAIPGVMLWVVAVVSLIILLAAFGFNLVGKGAWQGIIAILSLLVVAFIFAGAAGWVPPDVFGWLGLDDPGVQSMLFILAVFFLFVWWITKEDKDSSDGDNNNGRGVGKTLETLGQLIERGTGNSNSGNSN